MPGLQCNPSDGLHSAVNTMRGDVWGRTLLLRWPPAFTEVAFEHSRCAPDLRKSDESPNCCAKPFIAPFNVLPNLRARISVVLSLECVDEGHDFWYWVCWAGSGRGIG